MSSQHNHFTSGYISVTYDITDNFPFFWAALPDRAVDALKRAAQQAFDEAYPVTPYKPNDTRSTTHLRDSTYAQVYRNGEKGGSVYMQWRAANSSTGYRYAINQEFGNNLSTGASYQNYSTPGTGPGFMEKAWSVVEQMVPEYLEQEVQQLIQEDSV